MDLGHVAQLDWASLVEADANVLEIVDAAENSEAADHEHLRAAFDVAAGGVGAGLFQSVEDIIQIDAQIHHFTDVGLDVDLAHQAAVRDDVGDAGHLQEARRDHPVLQRAQGHRV